MTNSVNEEVLEQLKELDQQLEELNIPVEQKLKYSLAVAFARPSGAHQKK